MRTACLHWQSLPDTVWRGFFPSCRRALRKKLHKQAQSHQGAPAGPRFSMLTVEEHAWYLAYEGERTCLSCSDLSSYHSCDCIVNVRKPQR